MFVGDQTETLMEAFEIGLQYMNQYMFRPIPFLEHLPTPTNIRFRRALQTLDELTYGLIADRRALLRDNADAAPDDLLTMLLEAQDAIPIEIEIGEAAAAGLHHFGQADDVIAVLVDTVEAFLRQKR